MVFPYNPNEDEISDFFESGNNTPYIVRHGGSRVSLNLAIAPVFVLNDPATVEEIATFLATNPTFSVPLKNFVASTLSGSWTINGAHTVGDTTISVTAGTGTPQPGQWLLFGTKKKVYRVASYAAGTITLTKPLRHALAGGESITYSGTDGKLNAFDGVLCEFTNRDFGGPTHRIDSGLVARFGPFRLVESLA